MTNEEILQEILNKTESFKGIIVVSEDDKIVVITDSNGKNRKEIHIYEIILTKEFAREYFGTSKDTRPRDILGNFDRKYEKWEWELLEMAISKDVFKYLQQFLNK